MSNKKERIIPIQMEEDDDESHTSVESRVESLNISDKDFRKEKGLPFFNTKEKIILVVDTAIDSISTDFKVSGNNFTPFSMLKQSIEFFVSFKQSINPEHEYALVLIRESTIAWHIDFTNKVDKIINALEKVEACEDLEDIINLNQLFDLITQKIDIPQEYKEEDTILPPPYIVRVILLYARSFTVPVLEKNASVMEILSSPFFTLDVLMTHENMDTNNKSQQIFNILQNIDTKGFSYNFSVARDARVLRRSMAKLLGHPLQRPIQKLLNNSIRGLSL